jgi:hypothetical protein
MKYIAFLIALLFAAPAYAQLINDGPTLFLAVSPQYPKPGDTVTLKVQNPLEDLHTKTITWQNGNTIVLSGEGETVYIMTAPALGERADISVRVEGIDGEPHVSVQPLSVDLMWESDSYTPALYAGRHLPGLGTQITLQALPHIIKNGVELPASQLVYTWKQNGALVQTGRGKSSITIPVGRFADSSTVSVNVTTVDQQIGAERSTIITAANPIVRLYFDNPLYGTMYHNALGAKSYISDTEMSFVAIPYFTHASGANDPLFSYIWRVNEADVEANDVHPNTLTVNSGPAGGEARLELSLTHKTNYSLDVHGTWDVTFGSVGDIGGGSVDPFTGQ